MTYLLIYLKSIDQIIVNHNKRQDPMRHSPYFLVPKVAPLSWMAPVIKIIRQPGNSYIKIGKFQNTIE